MNRCWSSRARFLRVVAFAGFGAFLALRGHWIRAEEAEVSRLLYVATPGIRNYLEYGGHGIIVFAIDDNHRFVKRIPFDGTDEAGNPLNVKGICASAKTGRVWVTTLRHLISIDLASEKVLWQREYEGGCDRMSLSPDGKTMYLPTLEKDHWKVVDALSGDEIARVTPDSGAHNTIWGPSGERVYLAGLRSPILTVTDARTHKVALEVGPFAAPVRPFTVNGSETLVFACVNDLLGFEVGDLRTGKNSTASRSPASSVDQSNATAARATGSA